jgi:palmitoyltransferase ZDHHC13/17
MERQYRPVCFSNDDDYVTWVLTGAGVEQSHWWLNILFAIFLGLTTYFYVTTMMYDPGYVPKLNGIAEQKAVIDELLKQWKFDEANFCVTCMIRTPLRSKHCRRCQRCVAKHDQYVIPTGSKNDEC